MFGLFRKKDAAREALYRDVAAADADPRQTNLERIVKARRMYAGDPAPEPAPDEPSAAPAVFDTPDPAERDPLPRLPAAPAAVSPAAPSSRAPDNAEEEPARSRYDAEPESVAASEEPPRATTASRPTPIYRSAGLSDIREAVTGMREALEGFASRRARANAVMEGELQRLQQTAARDHLTEAVRLLAWLSERDRDVDEVLRAELRDRNG